MAETSKRLRDVLWTAGWDSTFRVLQAALIERLVVQPHYLVDLNRKSTGVEIAALTKIRSFVENEFPEATILPPKISNKNDFLPSSSVEEAFQELCARHKIGSQYKWLAMYAKRYPGVELSVHRDDRAYVHVQAMGASPATQEMFGEFGFPLLSMTKLQMAEMADGNGFGHLMEYTWFCHFPLASGEACGVCNPCIYTIEEGMAHRLSPTALKNYRLRRFKRFVRRAHGFVGRLARV